MKRLISALCAACLAVTWTVTLLPETASAIDVLYEGDYSYTVNEDGASVTISRYNGQETDVVIPSELGGMTVTQIGNDAFYHNSMTSVSIPDSVTSIGHEAFFNCLQLQKISIPSNVNSIGAGAFEYCSSLSGDITIPNGVTIIDDYTFYDCQKLTSLTIPDTVTYIGWGVCQECPNLTDIYFTGTEAQWNSIKECYSGYGVDALETATIHFNYVPELSNDHTNSSITFDNGNLFFSAIMEDSDSAKVELSIEQYNGDNKLRVHALRDDPEKNYGVVKLIMYLPEILGLENVGRIGHISMDATCVALEPWEYDSEDSDFVVGNFLGALGGNLAAEKQYDADHNIIQNTFAMHKEFSFDDWENPEHTWRIDADVPNQLPSNGYADNYEDAALYFFRWGQQNSVDIYLDNISFYDKDGNSIPIGGTSSIPPQKRDFDPIIDGNSFSHSNATSADGFFSVWNYDIPFEYELPFFVNGYLSPWELWKHEENRVEQKNWWNYNRWVGSCYGLSTVMLLQYYNMIDVLKISNQKNKPTTFYKMEAPNTNREFLYTIQYYMLSQFSEKNWDEIKVAETKTIDHYLKDRDYRNASPAQINEAITAAKSAFEAARTETLKEIVRVTSASNKPYLLCYDYTHNGNIYGHAIIAFGCRQETDGYHVTLFDQNAIGQTSEMIIEPDYSYFRFDNGGLTKDNCAGLFLLDVTTSKLPLPPNDAANTGTVNTRYNSAAVSVQNDEMTVTFNANASFKLDLSNGTYLDYDGEYVSSNAEISDIRDVFDENPQICVTLPRADSMTLENLGGAIDLTVSGADTLLSLESAEVSGAVFDFKQNRIQMDGTKGEFRVFLPGDQALTDGNGGFLTFTGSTEGNVDISATDGTISVQSDSLISDASAMSFTQQKKYSYFAADSNVLSMQLAPQGSLHSDNLTELGDINHDKSITVSDAVILSKYVAEYEDIPDNQLIGSRRYDVADLDGDGMITILDVRAILHELQMNY